MAKQEIWRLVFKDQNQYYKVCNFWGWDKDATLNIKIYSARLLRGLKVSAVSETEINNPDGTLSVVQTISYNDVIPTNFVPEKHTFHPSGFLHTTNKKGERSESGIKSIPFERIDKFHLLTIIVPQDPTKCPAILEKDLEENDITLDVNLFNKSPFQINVYIVREKNNPPVNPKASISADIICGDAEDYRLFVRCEQTPEMIGKPFPPYTFIGTPVLKN